MKTPRIKLEYVVNHSYPSYHGKEGDRGYSTARVLVTMEHEQTVAYSGPYRSEVREEIASKRFDWGNGDGADESLEKGAEWAVKGLAALLKKLWPEEEG